MADILLKDKNGTKTPHSGVKYISVPSSAGGKTNYMSVETPRIYYATMDNPREGVYTFTIVGTWFCDSRNYTFFGSIDDAMCRELGKKVDDIYQLVVLFSQRTLQTGKTYYDSEL